MADKRILDEVIAAAPNRRGFLQKIAMAGAAAAAAGKFAGLGGERDLERQVGFIKKGVRFVTTQTDIGFLMAEAGRRTEQIRKAMG